MKLITCEFNMDSGCVELRFDDGTALDIDCTAVENMYGLTILQRSNLDWLIYNAPQEYAELLLSGKMKDYLTLEDAHSQLDS